MIAKAKLSLIAARGRNGIIGASGGLPWRLKSDLQNFKAVTLGKPVIMGRKTWESLPVRPLKSRENIVISRDWTFDAPGARVYTNFIAAVNSAKAMAVKADQTEAFVIGGEAIYAMALPHADRLYLSDVDTAPTGDAHFPPFDENLWTEQSRQTVPADADNEFAFTLRVLERAA